MGVKVTIPNNSSDSVTFGSANTAIAAEVKGVDNGSSNGSLVFNTTASGTSAEKMRIDSSGFVGIGTSSPTTTLDVRGPGYFINGTDNHVKILTDNGSLEISRSAGDAYIDLKNADSEDFDCRIQSSGTAGDLRLLATTTQQFYTSGSERMRITSNGGVSFGSSGTAYGTSGQVLTSNGNAAPTWVSLSNVIAYQSVSTTTVTTSSDAFSNIITLAITPASANSKFIIHASSSIYGSGGTQNGCRYQLTRNGTQLYLGASWHALNNIITLPIHAQYYDAPATTSTVTYALTFARYIASGSLSTNGNTNSIVVIEIK